MIYALALATNFNKEQYLQQAMTALADIGQINWSSVYVIPCRDGVGEDYWNAAALLTCDMSLDALQGDLKVLEQQAGRVRPSHQISLDVDLIAWGEDLSQMQFNPKKLPLALDVKIPLFELWQHGMLNHAEHTYQQVQLVQKV